MELRYLQYFQTVAEELHFRRAAERLFISQPGLSRQILQLEEELGVRLFDRHSRRVELTPAGRYLHERTTLWLRDLDQTIANTRLTGQGLRGHLRIGYIGSAMQQTIPALLLAVKETYPDVHVSLRELENPAQVLALQNRELDLGFVRMERVPAPLVARPVLEDTFSLVLPEGYPLTAEEFTGLAALRHEPFILFEPAYSESYYENVMQLFDDAGFTPTLSHSTVNASSIYRLVANGFGLAIVPTILREGYAMPVKFIELTQVPQRTTLRVVWDGENEDALLGNVLGLL